MIPTNWLLSRDPLAEPPTTLLTLLENLLHLLWLLLLLATGPLLALLLALLTLLATELLSSSFLDGLLLLGPFAPPLRRPASALRYLLGLCTLTASSARTPATLPLLLLP